jgi:hypothetical protein
MPFDAGLVAYVRMALLVSSLPLSLKIHFRLAALDHQPIQFSRHGGTGERVSATGARLSRLQSSTMVRMRNRRSPKTYLPLLPGPSAHLGMTIADTEFTNRPKQNPADFRRGQSAVRNQLLVQLLFFDEGSVPTAKQVPLR